MPLLLLAIGDELTPLGIGLASLNAALAVVMLAMTLPRAPGAARGAPLAAAAPALTD
jgi:hypothetical protein